ncbi:MAG: glycosyltransferase family A protein [Balneolaceae bacterium]|nr:glycosyltransferase family A protein [Balneolaceae bacterium]
MNKPLVTIAIPTYNRADKYLRSTLECAVGQTYDNIEILVSDNCSTDHTGEVVRSIDDSRLTYYRQEQNLGAYGNWNFLLQKARGDYFHMYHDDDRIDEDFIETCMEEAGFSRDWSLIMTGSRVIDEHNHILRENANLLDGVPVQDLALKWYQGQVNIFFCSSLFNTEVLRSVGGFEPKYDHYIDVAAQFKCAAAGKRLDIPYVKASFRKHQGSLTSKSSNYIDGWIGDAKRLLGLVHSLVPGNVDELDTYGKSKSSQNMYMYASEIASRTERAKAFFKIYRSFGYRHLPPMKYANELVPFLGYLLHPYRAASLFKWNLLNNSWYNRELY